MRAWIVLLLVCILADTAALATVAEFPLADSLISANLYNPAAKILFADWLQACKQLPSGASWATETLTSGGAVTLEQCANYIVSFNGSNDNMDLLGISLPQGSVVILRCSAPGSYSITARHGIGGNGSMYLENGDNFVMDSEFKYLGLIRYSPARRRKATGCGWRAPSVRLPRPRLMR
jgi:hypothetical protein